MTRYREQLAEVATLPQLVEVAAELHAEDVATATSTSCPRCWPGCRPPRSWPPEVLRRFEPWTEMMETAITRVVAGTPYEQLLPVADLADVISALFVGLELMTHLDPDRSREQSLFSTIGLMVRLLEGLLARPAGGTMRT